MKSVRKILLLTQGLLVTGGRSVVCPRPTPIHLFIRRQCEIGNSDDGAMMTEKKLFSKWQFAPSQLADRLPVDPVKENQIRRNIPDVIFSDVAPTPFKTPPKLVAFSEEVLRDLLDLDPVVVTSAEFLDWVAGNTVLPGSRPLAHRYGGHQFGYWAEQLGDGRAHLLGEYINANGQRWELQLKGSGRTPYSRFGDGRAVLRSSVREFLCSEAMHHLGIPTSRAATLIVTDDPVPRDMFYNGKLKNERGAVVLRVAPSWFRFGSFEILALNGEYAQLKKLTDFILEINFPHLLVDNVKLEDAYLAMFSEICERTAMLIAQWDAIGFAHGVLNTDNMSVLSLAIDYGPFGFVDAYSPHYTPNHSDDEGRYDLGNQANIGRWNLERLAKALRPLLPADLRSSLDLIVSGFPRLYQKQWLELFRAKLGLRGAEPGDSELVELLLNCMETTEADFTQTFRDLSEISQSDLASLSIPSSHWGLTACLKSKKFSKFVELYLTRLTAESDETARLTAMQAVNPRYVLRNWMAQRAIEAAERDDFSEVEFLLRLLQTPYRVSQEAEAKGYASPPPDWARTLVLSCSS